MLQSGRKHTDTKPQRRQRNGKHTSTADVSRFRTHPRGYVDCTTRPCYYNHLPVLDVDHKAVATVIVVGHDTSNTATSVRTLEGCGVERQTRRVYFMVNQGNRVSNSFYHGSALAGVLAA